jgi:hypothetical protein
MRLLKGAHRRHWILLGILLGLLALKSQFDPYPAGDFGRDGSYRGRRSGDERRPLSPGLRGASPSEPRLSPVAARPRRRRRDDRPRTRGLSASRDPLLRGTHPSLRPRECGRQELGKPRRAGLPPQRPAPRWTPGGAVAGHQRRVLQVYVAALHRGARVLPGLRFGALPGESGRGLVCPVGCRLRRSRRLRIPDAISVPGTDSGERGLPPARWSTRAHLSTRGSRRCGLRRRPDSDVDRVSLDLLRDSIRGAHPPMRLRSDSSSTQFPSRSSG